MKFQVNDEVSWLSKSGGAEKLKTGTVLGICLAGTDPQAVHPDLLKLPLRSPRWACRYAGRSKHDRYVIAVNRGGKSSLTDFYTPRVSTIDRFLDGGSA
jgi:hypothetical protein